MGLRPNGAADVDRNEVRRHHLSKNADAGPNAWQKPHGEDATNAEGGAPGLSGGFWGIGGRRTGGRE